MKGPSSEPAMSPGDFRIFTFGSARQSTVAFSMREGAETRWNIVKDTLLEAWDLWGMPASWWHSEPGIPAELTGGPHAIITDEDARAWQDLAMARRRYLVSLGIDPVCPRRNVPFGHG